MAETHDYVPVGALLWPGMTDNSSEQSDRIVDLSATDGAPITVPRSTVTAADRGWGRAR